MGTSDVTYYAFTAFFRATDHDYVLEYKIKPDETKEISSNLSLDTENKDTVFVLITDPFFSNLVTGIRYNGDETMTKIRIIESDSVLIWNNNKYINDSEVNNKKGKISDSGIVEITIDMNDSWKTNKELEEIAKSYFDKSSVGYADQIEMVTDVNQFKIGDVVRINKFGINNKYIVTSITEKNKNNDNDYIIKVQDSSTLGNFVDTFRTEPTQLEENKDYETFITHYNQNRITQTTEVVV